MAMMVSPEVAKLFQVLTGEEWPDANEDHLRALAGEWALAARQLHNELGPGLRAAIHNIRETFSGKAERAFAERMAPFVEGENHIDMAAELFQQLADFLVGLALDVEYMKLVIILSLIALMAEIAWAYAMAPYTAGSSLVWLAGRIAIVRFMLKRLITKVLLQFAQLAVISLAFQLIVDIVAQLIQFGMKTRTDWDEKKTANAAGVGAMGAALAPFMMPLRGVFGRAFDGLLNKLFASRFGKNWNRHLGREIAEIGTEAFHETLTEALYKYATTGEFEMNPYAASSGAISSAGTNISAGLGKPSVTKAGPGGTEGPEAQGPEADPNVTDPSGDSGDSGGSGGLDTNGPTGNAGSGPAGGIGGIGGAAGGSPNGPLGQGGSVGGSVGGSPNGPAGQGGSIGGSPTGPVGQPGGGSPNGTVGQNGSTSGSPHGQPSRGGPSSSPAGQSGSTGSSSNGPVGQNGSTTSSPNGSSEQAGSTPNTSQGHGDTSLGQLGDSTVNAPNSSTNPVVNSSDGQVTASVTDVTDSPQETVGNQPGTENTSLGTDTTRHTDGLDSNPTTTSSTTTASSTATTSATNQPVVLTQDQSTGSETTTDVTEHGSSTAAPSPTVNDPNSGAANPTPSQQARPATSAATPVPAPSAPSKPAAGRGHTKRTRTQTTPPDTTSRETSPSRDTTPLTAPATQAPAMPATEQPEAKAEEAVASVGLTQPQPVTQRPKTDALAGKSDDGVTDTPNPPRQLSSVLPKTEWWRIYLDPYHHATAQQKLPANPGFLYDTEQSPGFQQGMVEAFERFLDDPAIGTRRLTSTDYIGMHEAVAVTLKRPDITLSGTSSILDKVTSFPLRAAEPTPEVLQETVGGRPLLAKISFGTPIDRNAPRPVSILNTWTARNTTISINYSKSETLGLVDSVFEAFYAETANATPDGRLRAIGRVIRALQIIHPYTDANRRLNVHVLLPRLMLEQGFKPVVDPRLRQIFQGGHSLDAIAEVLREGQNRGLTEDVPLPPTENMDGPSIADPRGDAYSEYIEALEAYDAAVSNDFERGAPSGPAHTAAMEQLTKSINVLAEHDNVNLSVEQRRLNQAVQARFDAWTNHASANELAAHDIAVRDAYRDVYGSSGSEPSSPPTHTDALGGRGDRESGGRHGRQSYRDIPALKEPSGRTKSHAELADAKRDGTAHEERVIRPPMDTGGQPAGAPPVRVWTHAQAGKWFSDVLHEYRMNVFLSGGGALGFQQGARSINDLDFRITTGEAGFRDFNEEAAQNLLKFLNGKVDQLRAKYRTDLNAGRVDSGALAERFFAIGGAAGSRTIGSPNLLGIEVSLSVVPGQRPSTLSPDALGFEVLPMKELRADKLRTMISRTKTGQESVKKVAQDLLDLLDSMNLVQDGDPKDDSATLVEQTADQVAESIRARFEQYSDTNLDGQQLHHLSNDDLFDLMAGRTVLTARAYAKGGQRHDAWTQLLENIAEHSKPSVVPRLMDRLAALASVPVEPDVVHTLRPWMRQWDNPETFGPPASSKSARTSVRPGAAPGELPPPVSDPPPPASVETLLDIHADDIVGNLRGVLGNRSTNDIEKVVRVLAFNKGFRRLDNSGDSRQTLEAFGLSKSEFNRAFNVLRDRGLVLHSTAGLTLTEAGWRLVPTHGPTAVLGPNGEAVVPATTSQPSTPLELARVEQMAKEARDNLSTLSNDTRDKLRRRAMVVLSRQGWTSTFPSKSHREAVDIISAELNDGDGNAVRDLAKALFERRHDYFRLVPPAPVATESRGATPTDTLGGRGQSPATIDPALLSTPAPPPAAWELPVSPHWARLAIAGLSRNPLATTSPQQADAFYQQLRTSTFVHPWAGPTGMPTQHPEDGCYLRAHYWVRQLQMWGVDARKVFIAKGPNGLLTTSANALGATSDAPRPVRWTYHVAPLITINPGDGGPPRPVVLDPAMSYDNAGTPFGGVVPVGDWVAAAGITSGFDETTLFADKPAHWFEGRPLAEDEVRVLVADPHMIFPPWSGIAAPMSPHAADTQIYEFLDTAYNYASEAQARAYFRDWHGALTPAAKALFNSMHDSLDNAGVQAFHTRFRGWTQQQHTTFAIRLDSGHESGMNFGLSWEAQVAAAQASLSTLDPKVRSGRWTMALTVTSAFNRMPDFATFSANDPEQVRFLQIIDVVSARLGSHGGPSAYGLSERLAIEHGTLISLQALTVNDPAFMAVHQFGQPAANHTPAIDMSIFDQWLAETTDTSQPAQTDTLGALSRPADPNSASAVEHGQSDQDSVPEPVRRPGKRSRDEFEADGGPVTFPEPPSLRPLPERLVPPAPEDTAVLLAVVPDGTRFADPATFVELINGSRSRRGRDVNCVDAALAFHSTYHGSPRVAGTGGRSAPRGASTAVGDELGFAAEMFSRGPAGLAEVVARVRRAGHGADAVVFGYPSKGQGHAWNVVNHHGEVSFVDAQEGEITDTSTIPIPDLDRVYAIPLDADGNYVADLPAPPPPPSDPDPYTMAEHARAVAVHEVRAALAAGEEVPVPGTTGRLVQTIGGLRLVGAVVTAELAAELAARTNRELIAMVVGPDGEPGDPDRYVVVRFFPRGRPQQVA